MYSSDGRKRKEYAIAENNVALFYIDTRHILENEEICIEVDTHGAELKSLVRKDTGTEYMWKADPQFWGRT